MGPLTAEICSVEQQIMSATFPAVGWGGGGVWYEKDIQKKIVVYFLFLSKSLTQNL